MTSDLDSTMYLDADGGVTWTALERDLRGSDSGEFAAALADAEAGRHAVATLFERLGATWTTTRVLRSRPPATVFVEARFERFDALWDRICEGLAGVPQSSVQRDTGHVTWTWKCVEAPSQAGGPWSEEPDMDGVLLDLLDGLEVVLEDGRFVGASGFALSEQGRKAIVRDKADGDPTVTPAIREDGSLVLSLSWDQPDRR